MTLKQAYIHWKSCHYDLFLKFDKTTSGIIEPLDILSIPEDELPSLISGRGNETNLITLQKLRRKAELQDDIYDPEN